MQMTLVFFGLTCLNTYKIIIYIIIQYVFSLLRVRLFVVLIEPSPTLFGTSVHAHLHQKHRDITDGGSR